MIYLIANTKGGVGKTTIAVNLAAWLSRSSKTLLMDTDKQESAKSWWIWRNELKLPNNPRITTLQDDLVYEEGMKLANEYENIVIDAGGRDSNSLRFALLLADRVIAPISTSSFDTGAWDDFHSAYKMARTANHTLDLRVVMSRIHPGRSHTRTNDLEKFMADINVPVMNSIIPEMVAFVDANELGMGVFERNEDDKAAFSMKKFFREVTS
jgi:chromosome partitioning protein